MRNGTPAVAQGLDRRVEAVEVAGTSGMATTSTPQSAAAARVGAR